jgi:hypothetical protein
MSWDNRAVVNVRRSIYRKNRPQRMRMIRVTRHFKYEFIRDKCAATSDHAIYM